MDEAHDRYIQGIIDRTSKLLAGRSAVADTIVENAELRARIAALESQLADRHAERVREIDAHTERVAGLEAEIERLRARLDEAEIERVRSDLAWSEENAELRADLVWAVNNCAGLVGGGKLVTDNYEHEFYCDGTPDSICRAVRDGRLG